LNEYSKITNACIQEFTSLIKLTFGGDKYTNQTISKLTKLRTLKLSCCRNIDYESVSELKELSSFSFGQDNIKDNELNCMTNLTMLKITKINGNNNNVHWPYFENFY
jgi:hypothetical protein